MSEYRVALRHTTLLESAALEAKGDDQHFIASAAPPPTNSILTLHEVGPSDDAEGTRQFFLVDKVFEVEGDDQVCGVLGKLTDAQAHEDASMMGTEHLEDGQAPPEDHAPAMAMPSPVVDPDLDDTDDDLHDEDFGAESGESERAEGEPLEASTDESAPDGESGESTAADAEGGTGSSKRSRRRNRRRR